MQRFISLLNQYLEWWFDFVCMLKSSLLAFTRIQYDYIIRIGCQEKELYVGDRKLYKHDHFIVRTNNSSVGFTTDSVHSILAQVNQNSHNKVKIAIQFEDGWNVDGWCVRVEKGLCKHYKGFKSWMWAQRLVCCFQENQAGLSPCVSYKVEGMELTKTARGVS